MGHYHWRFWSLEMKWQNAKQNLIKIANRIQNHQRIFISFYIKGYNYVKWNTLKLMLLLIKKQRHLLSNIQLQKRFYNWIKSFWTSICQCMSEHAQYMSVPASTCQNLHSTCQYLPVHVRICQYLSVPASTCQNMHSTCQYLPVHVSNFKNPKSCQKYVCSV